MTLRIATPNQAVMLTIPVINMGKIPSTATQIRLTMTEAATAPLAARKTIDSTVEDIDLSLIK